MDFNKKVMVDNVSIIDAEFLNGVQDGVAEGITKAEKAIDLRASSTEYGMVKIPTKSGIVSYDGELIINTNSQYGTSRTGDGKVVISAAEESDIDTGTNKYKPIVPSNLEYAVNSVVGKYSQKPVRIGTWMDGTPVWRVAFSHEFTEQDILDIAEYSNFTLPCYYKDGDYCFYLNSFAALHMEEPCIIDDAFCENTGGVYVNFTEGIVKRIVEKVLTGIHGYIEFVTPESNLKEG